jgi:hypothetical protein
MFLEILCKCIENEIHKYLIYILYVLFLFILLGKSVKNKFLFSMTA